jgi:hypothetical protein
MNPPIEAATSFIPALPHTIDLKAPDTNAGEGDTGGKYPADTMVHD